MACGVESVECGVWSIECRVWSVKCRVRSVECAVGKVWTVAGDVVVRVMLLCWLCCAGDFVVLVISFVLVILLRWCCSLVISFCWCVCCAGDFVALVMLLCL